MTTLGVLTCSIHGPLERGTCRTCVIRERIAQIRQRGGNVPIPAWLQLALAELAAKQLDAQEARA